MGLSGIVFVVTLDFESVECPSRILAPLQGPLYVFIFFVHQKYVGTDIPSSVCKSVEQPTLGSYVVVAVPMKALVTVGRFPV